MPIETKITDTRLFTVPIPANETDTKLVVLRLTEAAKDGYVLVGASTMERGNQRDPIVSGLRLTMRREP
jgi:hypothetical protein